MLLEIVQQLVNALTLGSMYVLIALGFSLFFGVIGVINLAHGDIAMLGAFGALVALQLLTGGLGADGGTLVVLVAMMFAIGASGGAGYLLETIVFRPLRGRPRILGIVSSIGFGIALRELVRIVYPNGANPQPFPSVIPTAPFFIGPVIITSTQILIIATSLILVGALFWFVARTWFGRAMRAILMDLPMAEAVGIRSNRIIVVTFILGSGLAGIAGVLEGLYYHSVKFDMGFLLGLKGFVAAVFGGLGSIFGAIVGGLLLGFLEAFAEGYLPGGGDYKSVYSFTVLILILVFRPTGLIPEAALKKG